MHKLINKLFKRNIRMGKVGRTIFIIAVSVVVIAAIIYVIFI